MEYAQKLQAITKAQQKFSQKVLSSSKEIMGSRSCTSTLLARDSEERVEQAESSSGVAHALTYVRRYRRTYLIPYSSISTHRHDNTMFNIIYDDLSGWRYMRTLAARGEIIGIH
jgi:hypothetical protein